MDGNPRLNAFSMLTCLTPNGLRDQYAGNENVVVGKEIGSPGGGSSEVAEISRQK
jgi:hypothetical protein